MMMYIVNTNENANQNNHNIAPTISNHIPMWYYISILYDCVWYDILYQFYVAVWWQ